MERIYTRLLVKVVAVLAIAMVLPANAGIIQEPPARQHIQTPEFILKKWTQDCDKGQTAACFSLADDSLDADMHLMIDKGYPISQRTIDYFKRTMALWSQDCDKGDAMACKNAWIYLARPDLYRKADPDQSRIYYEKALHLFSDECSRKVAASCYAAGNLLEPKYNEPKNPALLKQAFDFYRLACTYDSTFGCYSTASMGKRYNDLNLSKDEIAHFYARSVALEEQFCDKDSAFDCSAAAFAYKMGDGTAKDPAKAREYYARAAILYRNGCDKGIAESCSIAGQMYATDDEVSANLALSRQILEAGCKLYSRDACIALQNYFGVSR